MSQCGRDREQRYSMFLFWSVLNMKVLLENVFHTDSQSVPQSRLVLVIVRVSFRRLCLDPPRQSVGSSSLLMQTCGSRNVENILQNLDVDAPTLHTWPTCSFQTFRPALLLEYTVHSPLSCTLRIHLKHMHMRACIHSFGQFLSRSLFVKKSHKNWW